MMMMMISQEPSLKNKTIIRIIIRNKTMGMDNHSKINTKGIVTMTTNMTTSIQITMISMAIMTTPIITIIRITIMQMITTTITKVMITTIRTVMTMGIKVHQTITRIPTIITTQIIIQIMITMLQW
jgi:hypothetical protein